MTHVQPNVLHPARRAGPTFGPGYNAGVLAVRRFAGACVDSPLPTGLRSDGNGEFVPRFVVRFAAAAARVPCSGRTSLSVLGAEAALVVSDDADSVRVVRHSCSACSQWRKSQPSGRPSFSQSS